MSTSVSTIDAPEALAAIEIAASPTMYADAIGRALASTRAVYAVDAPTIARTLDPGW